MRKVLLITTLFLGLVLLVQAENHLLKTHLSRGYDYLNKGQAKDAIIEFLEVLSVDPENSTAIEGIDSQVVK